MNRGIFSGYGSPGFVKLVSLVAIILTMPLPCYSAISKTVDEFYGTVTLKSLNHEGVDPFDAARFTRSEGHPVELVLYYYVPEGCLLDLACTTYAYDLVMRIETLSGPYHPF